MIEPQVEDLAKLGIVDGLVQCMDCGKTTPKGREPEHYASCEPGSAEKWGKYYDEEEGL